MALDTINVLKCLFVLMHIHRYHYKNPVSVNIYDHSDCIWRRYNKAETWQHERDKQSLLIALQAVMSQQADNPDDVY